MKKYIQDMDREDLKNLFDKNDKLRIAILENAIENVDFWISEYLNGIGRAADCSIGTYAPNYMTVENIPDFLEWVESCHECFGIWYDLERETLGEVKRLIDKALYLHEKLEYDWADLSDENYNRIENRLDEILDLFTDEFLKCCKDEYNYYYNDDNLFSYWLDELYSGAGFWEGYYIDTEKNENAVYMDYTKEIA